MTIILSMERGFWYGMISFLLISLLVSGSSAVTLSIQDLTLTSPGDTGSSALVLDSAPDGIAGFKINLTMSPGGIARLTDDGFPPAFSGMSNTTPLPAEGVRVIAVDLVKGVEAGATNITLCTFTIEGVTSGSTGVQLSIGELTDDNGNPVNAAIQNASVTVGSATPAPDVVDFIASPRQGTSPLTVSFSPSVTGSVSGYIWSFGDGTSSDLASPTHEYTTGTYDVTLLVQFAGGSSASALKPGYITVTAVEPVPTRTISPVPTLTPVPLVANFSASPMTGAPPLTVQFTDLSEGSPTKWKWNFGDGTLSTMRNPVHVYGGIGRYTVTLEVKHREQSAIVRKTEYVKTSGPKR